MELIDNIIEKIGRTAMQHTVRKKYGDFNLAKASDRKKAQSIITSLLQQAQSFTRSEVEGWRKAWKEAMDIDNPNRRKLYQIYRDTDIDLHLTGCVTQRRDMVKARTFRLEDAKGKANEEALILFDATWFKDFIDYVLEANLWGHSLIELGDIVTDAEGRMSYEGVTLIPREHVIPEYGRVIIDPSDDWRSGIDYRHGTFANPLIEVGKAKDLGLYLKATPQAISKKNMLAFWDNFGQLFGMPMRIAKTATRDEKELQKIYQMMEQMGDAFWGVLPEGLEIQLIESTRGDAYHVYDKRIDRANSEMSKLILGQTMTIEDGSSLSQSQIHLEVLNRLVESDCDKLRDTINTKLLPAMVANGFPVKGLRFCWDYSQDYTPEQQIGYETMIADRYEVDPEYFAQKYNIPVKAKRRATPTKEEEKLVHSVLSLLRASKENRFFD